MEKGDTFPLGTLARHVVDQADTGEAAAFEGTVEVVDREADVMDARASFGDELADWRGRVVRREELDERLAGGESGDSGTIGVVEVDRRETEQVAVEGEHVVERAHGDPHVGDSRCTAGYVSHVSALVRRGAGAEY